MAKLCHLLRRYFTAGTVVASILSLLFFANRENSPGCSFVASPLVNADGE